MSLGAAWPLRLMAHMRARGLQVAAAARADWAGTWLYTYCAAVTPLTWVVIAAFLINNPAPDPCVGCSL